MKKLWPFIFIFLLLSGPVLAADYYVKNAGDDAKDGLSDGNAWKTITKVNAEMGNFNPGDTISFNRGDTWTVGVGGEELLNITCSGSDPDYITFGAYGTGALPIIDGNNDASTYCIKIRAHQEETNISWVALEYLDIYNSRLELISIYACNDYNIDYLKIENCTIRTNSTDGRMGVSVYIETTDTQGNIDHFTFDSNTIYDITHNGIQLNDGVTNSSVTNNYFYDIEHTAIDMLNQEGTISNDSITITGNEIYNSQAGIFATRLQNSLIADNEFHESYKWEPPSNMFGIKIQTATTSAVTIRNNRFWKLDDEGYAIIVYDCTNCNVWNNTVYDCTDTFTEASNTGLSNDNNLAYACASDETELPNYGSDPKFVNPENGDLTLRFDSPAIGNGTDLGDSLSYGVHPVTGAMVDQDDYNHTGSIGSVGWEDGAFVYIGTTGAALTGTLADGATEVQIVTGGETLIITLSEDTWVATIGDDNGFTDGLIAGIDSGGAETHGWDVEVKGNMVHGDVVRTNDTTVTITLEAEASYAITSNETITVTIPADNLVESDSAVVATPTFEITATSDPAAALTGTLADNATEAQIVTGGETLIITLTNDTWVAAGATFDGQRAAIIAGMDSAQAEATGWDAEVKAKEVVTAVVRTNDTVVTITLTAAAAYDISANESITVTVPATALVTSGSPVIATPAFAIIFFDTSTEEIVGMTLQ